MTRPASGGKDRIAKIEERLLAVFRDVLAIEHIGLHDEFFALGGHSLLVMRAAVRIEATLGVDIPPSVLFNHPTVAALAPHVAARGADPLHVPRGPSVQGGTAGGSSSLSAAQRGLWFLDQAIGRRAAYLLPDVWHLRGPLDVEALRHALAGVVARHPALRTRFEVVDGQPRQVVDMPAGFDLPTLDLRQRPSSDQRDEVARLAGEEADRPFDLAKDLLMRASLIVLAADEHVLMLTVHHVASDAWSQRIVRRDLERLYQACHAGAPLLVNETTVQYAACAARQQARMTAGPRATLSKYWRHQLADLPRLELPTDRRRLTAWSDHGSEVVLEIPDALTAALERLATESRVTLQILLLAAYQVLLGRYAGQRDFGVATFASDRHDADAEDLVGLFVNTIVVRADLSGAPTFRELLARVRQTSLEAYDHQEFPFDTLVAELQLERQRGPTPLTPVAFQVLPFGDAPASLDGLAVTRMPGASQRVRFDVEVTIWKESTGLRCVLGYSTDLFDHDTMARFARHYSTLLEAIVETPDCVVADLRLLTDAERDEQLAQWSGVARSHADHALVPELFSAQAASTPDAPALVFDDERLTYRELEERADQLAARLLASSVRSGDVVAVHLDRSVELIVSMIGILKTGAAYLPLDPSHPVDRLVLMVRNSQAAALVAGPDVPEALAGAVPRCLSFTRDAAEPGVVTLPVPSLVTRPGSPAYVMYTSGSTGRPKGVAVAHRGITRLVRDTNYVRFTPDDCVAFASNPAFDAATFEVWGALLNGARLAYVDRETLLSAARLAQAIETHGITVMFLTAALFHQIAALAPQSVRHLRYLIAGGDVVDPAAARAVLEAGGPGHLVNGYGPTENTTFSATYEITPTFSGQRSVPIGRPITGSTCYVLDDRLALLPVGAAGELYLGGSGLAVGYVNEPQLTAERFIAHPFAPGERLYRTGDRARWRSEGHLEFLGRVDRQIKLNGHRIELEEIEHALARHEAVIACAVVLDDQRHPHPRLVAYVVGREALPSTDALRSHLRQSLPSYMLPEAIVELPALPLTPNGKVDRAALPAPERHRPRPATSRRVHRLLESPTSNEAIVREGFKDVLGVDAIESDQSFFDLGGTSLLAFTLSDQLSRRCACPISVANIFAHPTIAGLAASLTRDRATAPPRSILEVRRGGARAPLYFPPGVVAETVVGNPFIEELPADQPLYALIEHVDDRPRAFGMEAMAARFCADIASFQPDGPICLAGYSFGGLLAYEMARQLTSAGREVAVLAILDTGPDLSPGASLGDRLGRVVRFLQNVPRWIGEDLVRSFDRSTPTRLWRSVRKLVRPAPGRPGAVLSAQLPRADDLFDTAGWSPALRAHVENNLHILSAFRYGTYPGQVVLFRARVRPLFHAHTPDLGWGALAGAVRVIEVPGNHHTMTLEPHIRVVARQLRTVLEESAARSV